MSDLTASFPWFDTVVHPDCRHFKGDRPCLPHKREGVHCADCSHYEAIARRLLIIKLGAAGDVIRTTPLLRVLRQPGVQITWLTDSPEVLPQSWIDRILKLDAVNLAWLLATPFDALYNLDKDAQAIALCQLVQAREKYGFGCTNGVCLPLDERARAKWLTGLFDDYNRANRLSYPEELFALCDLPFQGEEYVVELEEAPPFNLDLRRPLVGLNSGCGARWTSRLWATANWEALIRALQKRGCGVLLLGGSDEHEKNLQLSGATGAEYLGHFPIKRFFSLVNEVDVLVTGVTMAMHVGIGLRKRIVLLNNIFNRCEFELYGLGQIVEPEVDCLGCFKPICETDCMNLLTPERVLTAVQAELAQLITHKKA